MYNQCNVIGQLVSQNGLALSLLSIICPPSYKVHCQVTYCVWHKGEIYIHCLLAIEKKNSELKPNNDL